MQSIEWHKYQLSRMSLKVTFVVMTDKACHAVPLRLQSFLFYFTCADGSRITKSSTSFNWRR